MMSFTFSSTNFLGIDLFTFFISYLDNSVVCPSSDAAPSVLVNNPSNTDQLLLRDLSGVLESSSGTSH